MCSETSIGNEHRNSVPERICYQRPTYASEAKPIIPAASADGLITPDSWRPHLIVHAPVHIGGPGNGNFPGDIFEAFIDGVLVPESRAIYNDETEYLEIKIPADCFAIRKEGVHTLAYMAYPLGFGEIAVSQEVTFRIDRNPPGGRCLPRIIFDEKIERDGLPMAKLSNPSFQLRGTIPDYADVDVRDTIHLFVKSRNSELELAAGSIRDGGTAAPIAALFDRDALKQAGPGRIDLYYYVTDASGDRSKASPPMTLDII